MRNYLYIIICVLFICAFNPLGLSQSDTNNNSNQSNQAGEKIYKDKEVTKSVLILTKPDPEYTLEARKHHVTGTVVLWVVFRSSGEVTNIRPKVRLPFGLTEKAMEAARRIKFKPAEIDGHPVSVLVEVEYEFRL